MPDGTVGAGVVGVAGDWLTGTSIGVVGVPATPVVVGDGELGEPPHAMMPMVHPTNRVSPSVLAVRVHIVWSKLRCGED